MLRGANFAGALLAMADLSLVDGRSAFAAGADLRGVRLERAVMTGADLSEVRAGPLPISGHMHWPPANLTLRSDGLGLSLRQGRTHPGKLGGTPISTKADLRGADLSRVSFCDAILTGADMRRAKRDGADFHRQRRYMPAEEGAAV